MDLISSQLTKSNTIFLLICWVPFHYFLSSSSMWLWMMKFSRNNSVPISYCIIEQSQSFCCLTLSQKVRQITSEIPMRPAWKTINYLWEQNIWQPELDWTLGFLGIVGLFSKSFLFQGSQTILWLHGRVCGFSKLWVSSRTFDGKKREKETNNLGCSFWGGIFDLIFDCH